MRDNTIQSTRGIYMVVITWMNEYYTCKQEIKIALSIKEAEKQILKRRNNPKTRSIDWHISEITETKQIRSGCSA